MNDIASAAEAGKEAAAAYQEAEYADDKFVDED